MALANFGLRGRSVRHVLTAWLHSKALRTLRLRPHFGPSLNSAAQGTLPFTGANGAALPRTTETPGRLISRLEPRTDRMPKSASYVDSQAVK